MSLNGKWHLVALLALLVVCAGLALSFAGYGGTSFVFVALLPAVLGLMAGYACAFAFSPWQLPFALEPSRPGLGCRAPPTTLPLV